MRFGDRLRRLRVGALVATLALVAVVWLETAPHRHADDRSEQRCPACQVLRAGGAPIPHAQASTPARPALVDRIVDVSPSPVDAGRPGAPPPGRSPPASLS